MIWYGVLNKDNAEQVQKIIQELVTSKTFSYVCCNELRGFRPELLSKQTLLRSSIELIRKDYCGTPYVYITVIGTGRLWSFEEGAFLEITPNKLLIKHKAPAGHNL